MPLEVGRFDIAEHLQSEVEISEFLTAAFESGDPAHIARSLGIVARSKSMTQLARDVGMSRAALYRAFNGETNPEFATIMKILDALGIQLSARVVGNEQNVA
jgi:probable addiction module antidote protein